MNTSITGSRFVLAVKDIKKSAEYYENQLGFKTLWSGEGWHFLGREKFVVMLGECRDEPPAFETGDHSYFAYIDVENIDELFREYSSKEINILSKVSDQPWVSAWMRVDSDLQKVYFYLIATRL
jgi:catechol 2,3-dioxygenase-like lactoylglutathione lyase family enzyme